jgi:hypothetical protein
MSTIPVCTASQWLTEGALSAQARTPANMANTDAARTSRRALILASPNVIHGAVAAHIQVRALAIWLAARFRTRPTCTSTPPPPLLPPSLLPPLAAATRRCTTTTTYPIIAESNEN